MYSQYNKIKRMNLFFIDNRRAFKLL